MKQVSLEQIVERLVDLGEPLDFTIKLEGQHGSIVISLEGRAKRRRRSREAT